MKRQTLLAAGAALIVGIAAGVSLAQQPPQGGQAQAPVPYFVGNRLGLPINPAADGMFTAMSTNVKVYGSVYSAESCSYDAARGVIVVPNRGVGQNVRTNDAWITFLNHDGSVHTSRWVGVQNPGAQRDNMTPPLVLNEPLGSDIVNGVLYLADRDGGTGPNDPQVNVIRKFTMANGMPAGEVRPMGAPAFNDIAIAADGTIYGTVTGGGGQMPDPTTWQVWRITAAGQASMFVQGAPLRQPNGIALDGQGNIVVVNIGSNDVLTFSPQAQLLRTEQAVQPGNDGLVIMADGTKYVSSVQQGGVSRIRPGQPAQMIAQNIPNPASMCYDSGANQLVIPMNANNALAFIPLN
jgi:hypothetical protein